MANRVPVDRGVRRVRLTPSASPVDTYVQRTDAGNALSQLAGALQSVAPEVAQFSDVKAKQQTEAQKAAGEQKARELFDSGKSYREAIKAGLIDPHESPWFQLGAKEQFGRVTAGKFASDLQAAMQKDPSISEATDVAQYDKFAADFKQQWVQDNVGAENRDLHFENGFGSMADSYSRDARSMFVAQAGKRLVAQVGDNHYGEIFTNVTHELSMNTDRSAIADMINYTNDKAIAMGIDPTVANQAVVKALGDIAIRDGDVSVFDLLKKVKAGGQTLEARPWAQEEIQRVTNQVYADKQRKHVADREQQVDAKNLAVDTQVSTLITTMLDSDNPSRLDLRADIEVLGKLDPEKAQTMVRFQQTASAAHFTSDEQVVTRTNADIYGIHDRTSHEYVTTDSLVGLVNIGEINRDDFVSLNEQVMRRDREETAATDKTNRKRNAFADPVFKRGLSTLAKPGFLSAGSTYDKTDTVERVKSAQAEFSNYFTEWLDTPTGQAASPSERIKFLNELLDQTTANWRTTEATGDAAGVGKKADLRTPAEKQRARSLLMRIDTELDGGTLSQPVKDYLRANNVTSELLPQWLEAQRKYLDGTPYDLDAFLAGKPQPSMARSQWDVLGQFNETVKSITKR